MIASLPMYDLTELRAITDAWWSALAAALRRQGVLDVPDVLYREGPRENAWRADALVLSQTCGYLLSNAFRDDLGLLLTPCYGFRGCRGSRYSSFVLVRDADPAVDLDDLDGSAFAVNGLDSWSGWHTVKRELRARGHDPARFVATIAVTGTHRASMAALTAGESRACAVDCVTHGLLAAHAPGAIAGTRVLHVTAMAPGLPYVTGAGMPTDTLERLRAGVMEALAHPKHAAIRAALGLTGAERLTPADYAFMDDAHADAGA